MRDKILEMAHVNIGSLCIFLKNKKNSEYLEEVLENIPKNSDDFSLSEKIYYYYHQIKEINKCNCGNRLKFIGFKQGFRETCGKRVCFIEKRKQTCLEKFGVDNPKKSKEIIYLEQERIRQKWNGDHYMNNQEIKNKFTQTMMERHSVCWAQQSQKISSKSKITWESNSKKEEIIEKRKNSFKQTFEKHDGRIIEKKNNTIIKNWGSKEILFEYINQKIKEKSIQKWNVEHHLASPEIIKKRVDSYKTNITKKIINKLPDSIIYLDRFENVNKTDSKIDLKCLDCSESFSINRQYLDFRIKNGEKICLICNPIFTGRSKSEIEVFNFISENYEKESFNSKRFDSIGEIDIFLPELNIGLEFNGLYWHSEIYKERTYHLEKTKEFLNIGISLFHIWEDDWLYKKNIVKSIIINKLGKTPNRIFARKCQIKEISDNKLVKDFLENNHIQGFIGSKIKLGLFYNDELVSLMTFGNLRKSLGQKSQEGSFEMLRFCNKLNTNVVGGASKLFSFFLKNYDIREIISYSDSSRSEGNLYKQLGFKIIHETDPNYYWIVDGIRKHRFNFRKDKLVKEGADPNKTEIQIMNEKGFYRIFDCGSKKWKFTTNL